MKYKTSKHNKRRAMWAESAIAAFSAKDEFSRPEEDETLLQDLLTDLMHWAKQNKNIKTPVNVILKDAVDNFSRESKETN